MVISSRAIPAGAYTCSFPGCPTPVTVSLSVIEELLAILYDSREDTQGLVYGTMHTGGTEIRSIRPIRALGVEELLPALAQSPTSLVGYYRIREGQSLTLTADELHLAETVFTRPGSVVLLVERRSPFPEANCFFFEDGRFLNFPLLAFPLDSASLIQREAQRQRRPAEEKNYIPESPLPSFELDSAPAITSRKADFPKRSRIGLLTFSIVGGLLFLACSAALILNRRRPVTEAGPGVSPTLTGTPLRAERQGEDLKIVWDLSSAAVATATSGVLEIVDGETPRQIPMNADQVRFGSLLYSPVSEQISVRLTTLKDNQATAQASVLVLLNKPAPGQHAEVKPQPSVQATTAIPVSPMPLEGPHRTATRVFVPPTAPAVPNPTIRSESSLPPLSGSNPVISPMPFPSATVSAPAAIVGAPSEPARSREATNGTTTATATRIELLKSLQTDFVPPVLISQGGVRTPPELPQILRPLAIRVHVDLNGSGRVTRAQAIPEKGVHALLLQAAEDAAWKCSFQPARQGQVSVASSLTVVFHLGPQR